MAFAPSDPQIIYVGTGESDGGVGFEHAGLGIMKSTDGGKTWTLLATSSFARGSVKRVRVHPTNPNVVLAATSRGGFGRDAQEGVPSPPPFGLLKSGDGGVTWVRTLAGQATALEVDPSNFNNQYAAIGDQRLGNEIAGPPGSATNGVYRSTDGGQTWTVLAGPWGASTATRAATGRIELAIAPSNPNAVYASMQISTNGGSSNTGLLGLYRTDNPWAPTPTWIQIPTIATGSGGYCYDGANGCGYVHVISVDPTDPNTLFAGGAHDNLWRCTNCGPSPVWTHQSQAGGGDHHAFGWAGSRLINGQDHGLWSTTDRGDSWQFHNELTTIVTFYGGALHPTNAIFVMGGIRDLGGIMIRSESGTWRIARGQSGSTRRPPGEAEVAISSRQPDTDWMAAFLFGAIDRTKDGGQTWTAADAGIDKTGAAFVPPVRKCPSNDDVFLTGTNRMWRANNFFNSAAPAWVPNGPAHPFQFPYWLTAPGTILTIDFAPSDTACNTYAYGNRGGQVQLTTDGGKTWGDLDPSKSLPARPVNSLAFDPANPNILYAALSSFNDATPGKPGHVFKTTNALATSPTWINVSPPDDVPYNVIVIDPRAPNSVYAGTDAGLWYSANSGAGWQRFGPNTGLPNASIYDFKINPATNMTVAFTYGRGAYSLDMTAVPSSGPVLAIPPTSTLLPGATGSSFSQSLSATGGNLPYTWSLNAGALPPGLSLSASGRISGIPTTAGASTFTVVVTDASGGIASQTYSMTIVAAGTVLRSGVLAHIAAGGGWTTVISLSNSSASPAAVTIAFHAPDGSALNLPLTAVLRGITQTTTAASFSGVINPNATLFISAGDQIPSTVVGWADVLSSGPVGGFEIFRFTDPNGTASEGTVPLQTQFPSRIVVPYDNAAGFSTGLAIANLSMTSVTVTATMWDPDGSQLGVQSITLPGSGHTSFFFHQRLAATAGKQGIVIFQSSGTGGLAALALRFAPFGTFTSVPTILGP